MAVHPWSFVYLCDSKQWETWGDGRYPTTDPWGRPFGPSYNPARWKVAGKAIGEVPGHPGVIWRGVLEGIQSDQDVLRLMFDLQRTASHQLHCHFCDPVQRISTRSEIGPLNNVESLYTSFGPGEGDASKLGNCLHPLWIFFTMCNLGCVCSTSVFSSWDPLIHRLRIIGREQFVELHGESPITKVVGFEPSRILAAWFRWPPKQFLNKDLKSTKSSLNIFRAQRKISIVWIKMQICILKKYIQIYDAYVRAENNKQTYFDVHQKHAPIELLKIVSLVNIPRHTARLHAHSSPCIGGRCSWKCFDGSGGPPGWINSWKFPWEQAGDPMGQL